MHKSGTFDKFGENYNLLSVYFSFNIILVFMVKHNAFYNCSPFCYKIGAFYLQVFYQHNGIAVFEGISITVFMAVRQICFLILDSFFCPGQMFPHPDIACQAIQQTKAPILKHASFCKRRP